jgi:N-methylhydantoinase B
VNAADLAVFDAFFGGVAEEMGEALVRAATSVNIKERRDLSCAIFDEAGRLVAQAAHIPVHLGAMPLSVRAALDRCPPNEGDVVCRGRLPGLSRIGPRHPRRRAADSAGAPGEGRRRR